MTDTDKQILKDRIDFFSVFFDALILENSIIISNNELYSHGLGISENIYGLKKILDSLTDK